MERLDEDGLFGAYTFDFNGEKLVSRDLLDSILEINFLDRHLGLARREGFNLLDVGAGYGRLAHRLATAFPGTMRIYCTDAVSESTFLCEYYLRFRGLADRTEVVPLDEIEARLRTVRIDVATNIHSFSECPMPQWNGGWISWPAPR
jgi:putative sugar O-methyltransferase